MTEYSIIPSSGAYGEGWESQLIIPQGENHSISVVGTSGNEGFVQQTFLGASIRSFSCTAGFGLGTSSLSVELVNDEYNKSDGTLVGSGSDVYHNGSYDEFKPPSAGAPVFFKFSKELADVESAWRQTFDDTYGYSTNNSTNSHFVFGGILQSYVQNQGPEANPVFSATVQDPREILSNATLILKNYAGTTYNNKNLFNIYGFLEYEPSNTLKQTLESSSTDKSVLKKTVDPTTGNIRYVGINNAGNLSNFGVDVYQFTNTSFAINNFPSTFPITGPGYSRTSDQGIPLYRIQQAISSLFEYNGQLPDEYKEKRFGGVVDFRGYKYVIDFSGIPFNKIPPMYFFDFEQIDILSFVQELCDIISHDMFITLLPVINHPACSWLYNKNQYHIGNGDYSNIITGIIRIDVVDRSVQPEYGAIKSYLENLESNGIYVENKDLGYELSNVTTDKFVVGAQEVDMYYFNNNKDRDNLELRKLKNGEDNYYELLQKDQWSLDTMLQQQILPFYGFLGKDAVTIPRGFGSYQQILLDASSLDADGVGNYYIATEMELRAAAVSYERWRDFLLMYDEVYIQELTENQVFLTQLASTSTDPIAAFNDFDDILQLSELKNRDFGVSVPRCVFNSDKPYMADDGYPASPCSPPYGYPLYYKRAEKIGIPEAGLTTVASSYTRVITNLDRIQTTAKNAKNFLEINGSKIDAHIKELENKLAKMSDKRRDALKSKIYDAKDQKKRIEDYIESSAGQVAILQGLLNRPDHKKMQKLLPSTARSYLKNARKVYDFVKNIADTYLGKQFLVRIPKACNVKYDPNITISNSDRNIADIEYGPFGFKPRPINTDITYETSSSFVSELNTVRSNLGDSPYQHYLDKSNLSNYTSKYTYGALSTNFNPISEKWEFNYEPDTQGGFFNYSLFNKNLSLIESLTLSDSQLPPATQQYLAPQDLTNFVTDGNRISCYVRYDHSQFLDFKNISKDSIAQQFVTDDGYIPDIMEEINNLNPDQSESLDAIANRLSGDTEDQPKESVAFVKCSVEPRFYMPPKITTRRTKVWARQYEFVPNLRSLNVVEERGDDGCITYKAAQEYAMPIFKVPHDTSGGNTAGGADGTYVNNQDFVRRHNDLINADIIETQSEQLDSDYVYAIIKLPGRVMPSVDSRYLDGPYKAFNAPQFYNLMTADVVKNVEGFDKPAMITNDNKPIDANTFTTEQLSNAQKAQRAALKGLALDLPEGVLTFTSPSPVYPDIVALPLRSKERCYGPWLSSFVPNNSGDIAKVRYSNIGGKVDFIKDETLAPWNFAGYQLMNDAGALRAQFSNSLFLFSERGGFVIPTMPTGIGLAKALKAGGPLVTSISVSVEPKISTTVKMDLYTSRFGKIQKQKDDAIAKVARERQKIIDITNNLRRQSLRGGLASNLSSVLDNNIVAAAKQSDEFLSSIQKGQTVYDNFVIAAKRNKTYAHDISGDEKLTINEVQYGSSMQSPGYVEEALAESPNPDVEYQGLAGGKLPFEGYSATPGDNAYFPAANYKNTQAINERVFGVGFDDYEVEE